MKILLTGRNGQVGFELEKALASLGPVIATDRSTLDIFYPDLIRQAVRQAKPDVIVNAAAYTAVDQAESEPDLAMEVNGVAPGVLGEEAKRLGALLVHYSTDYVFDGTKAGPYVETDQTNPLNVYGRTKLEGERRIAASGCRHLILRTSWVYSSRGRNFVRTILRKAASGDPLRVVNDQFGSPTWARDVAALAVQVLRLKNPPQGIYHAAAAGQASWLELAREAVRLRRLPVEVIAIPGSAYPVAARRPKYSVLDSTRLARGGSLQSIGHWQERLAVHLAADPPEAK